MKWPSSVKNINPRKKSSQVAREINRCECIASSSLHGLIFSDSFSIPNVHLKFSNKLAGGNHKFNDYYLGMNTSHNFLDFSKNLTVNDIIKVCKVVNNELVNEKIERVHSKFKEIINLIER
jgi:pyruvyltransferase